MNDKLAFNQIENLAVDDYITAFRQLRERMSNSDLLILEAHYKSPNFDMTATQLAKQINFKNHSAANLHYGRLADKFLKFFNIDSFDIKLDILVYLDKYDNEWHWILRPNVIQALKALNWFENPHPSNISQETEPLGAGFESPKETVRESITQSRIGQDKFREELIKYWQGCSVTSCKQIEVLRASHIKPWRDSSDAERLNLYNGLLLIPNLDSCFELGLISFTDEGRIIISNRLDRQAAELLGTKQDLKLLRIEQRHRDFMTYHRENIFH